MHSAFALSTKLCLSHFHLSDSLPIPLWESEGADVRSLAAYQLQPTSPFEMGFEEVQNYHNPVFYWCGATSEENSCYSFP